MSFNNYSKFMTNTFHTDGPIDFNILTVNKKPTDNSPTADGIPSTANGNRSPKEHIEKPSDQNK